MKKAPLFAAASGLAAILLAVPAQARIYIGLGAPLIAVAPPAAPPPLAEPAPPPRAGLVWIAGYRRWTGYGYVWVRGHWGRPPRPGAVWIGPGWRMGHGGWFWRSGHWG